VPDDSVLLVQDLAKTFKVGFARKVVDAVRGISFDVKRGEIFGFLGPNGAGKTTTIKMLMDLIRPTAGSIRLFGLSPRDMTSRRRVGYLPEQPYFYDYLTPVELMHFFGSIYGMDRAARAGRIDKLLRLVGVAYVRDRSLRSFSKGMVQRVGLAQSLIADPDLVVLDEPLSGLDPIGRREFKDIILGLKSAGKTVFFSSHILADIELLCDRIAIIDKGKLRYVGPLREFVLAGQKEVELIASGVAPEQAEALAGRCVKVETLGAQVKLVTSREAAPGVVSDLVQGGATVESVVPRSETLEDIFVRMAAPGGEAK